VYLNDLTTDFNTFAFLIIMTGDDHIKEIEMEETCRMHGTEDAYLKFSEVKVQLMP
jgi:hypothetical protein